jgi:hypothetical protein
MDKGLDHQQTLPVNPDFYTLLDSRVYTRTKKRIVALCVVESKFGTGLKLYEWVWKGEDKGWKVGLANLSVKSIDLERIARDAKELAAAYAIKLDWDSLRSANGSGADSH